MTHVYWVFLCAPFLGIGVEEDISATPLAVLVHDEPDLTGLQVGKRPAKGKERGIKGERGKVEKVMLKI